MAVVAGQIAKDGATEAKTREEGPVPVMMERGLRAAMGSITQESYWNPNRADRQMGAGSVRTGMELKIFTAGTKALMEADKATRVLAGRQADLKS